MWFLKHTPTGHLKSRLRFCAGTKEIVGSSVKLQHPSPALRKCPLKCNIQGKGAKEAVFDIIHDVLCDVDDKNYAHLSETWTKDVGTSSA